MVYYKTEEELEIIREGADILGRVHAEVAKKIRPGITTLELDTIAYNSILAYGALPSFKGYRGFPSTLCISINDVVVHGIPGAYVLIDGDIVSIDCGVFYKEFHSDSAYTYAVGEISEEESKLLTVTKESLYRGIDAAVAGNRIGDVGFSIQNFVESNRFSVVRDLVGHGVGKSLHESPEVPNFGKRGKGFKLEEGLVIAIEPMVNMGSAKVFQENDGWTIRTADRRPSAHFEHTVCIRKGKAEILTTFKYIEEVLKGV